MPDTFLRCRPPTAGWRGGESPAADIGGQREAPAADGAAAFRCARHAFSAAIVPPMSGISRTPGQRLANPAGHLAARPDRDPRRQLPAQRREPVARLPHGKAAGKRQRDDMRLVRERRAPDVLDRRLRAERNALRAFRHEQRLDHQQAEAVLLARETS